MESPGVSAKEWDAISAAEGMIEDNLGGPEEPQGGEAESAEKAEREELRGMLVQLIMAGGSMLAPRRGPHWIISEGEAEAIAEPLSEILAAMGLGAETPEMRLAIALGFVAVPRLMLDKKKSQGDNAKPVDHSEKGAE